MTTCPNCKKPLVAVWPSNNEILKQLNIITEEDDSVICFDVVRFLEWLYVNVRVRELKLPKRKKEGPEYFAQQEHIYARGFNAALDEVEKMNREDV